MSDLITNEILLNICSFFEIFYTLNPKLFPDAPLSPKDMIDELSSNPIPPTLNNLFFCLIHCCKSQNPIKKSSKYLANDELEHLLFNELHQREEEFILHCARNKEFEKLVQMQQLNQKQDRMDVDMNQNTKNKQEHDDSDELNEYGIPWHYVEYQQLPILYKVCSVLTFFWCLIVSLLCFSYPFCRTFAIGFWFQTKHSEY